jgi:hypothetical protein
MNQILTPGEIEFYESMSAYELVDLIFTGVSAQVEILAIYISILSAFFLVAYYFGDKLKSIELFLFSSVYTLICVIIFSAFYQTANSTAVMIYFSNGVNNTPATYISLGVMIIALVLSLSFMVKMSRSR